MSYVHTGEGSTVVISVSLSLSDLLSGGSLLSTYSTWIRSGLYVMLDYNDSAFFVFKPARLVGFFLAVAQSRHGTKRRSSLATRSPYTD